MYYNIRSGISAINNKKIKKYSVCSFMRLFKYRVYTSAGTYTMHGIILKGDDGKKGRVRIWKLYVQL